jgi:hypothetical protein
MQGLDDLAIYANVAMRKLTPYRSYAAFAENRLLIRFSPQKTVFIDEILIAFNLANVDR